MRITIIHGQNHHGSTYHVGRLLLDSIQRDKEVSEFFLPRDLNHFCLGCYSCLTDDSACPFYTEKRAIMDAVEASDVLIFTTPTYCMRASAPMKAFLDLTFTYWMTHRPRKSMFGKRAVVLSTAAGMGAGSAVKDVSLALTYWGVPWIRTWGKSVQAMNWDGVSEKKKAEIAGDMQKMARKLESSDVPRVGLKTRALFYFMRGMQKAGWGSSPVEKEYWQEQGWLNKARPWQRTYCLPL